MNDFLRGLKHGARVLLKKAGFAGVAIISLALGIAANNSIFGLFDMILLGTAFRPQKPDQLCLVITRQIPEPEPNGTSIPWLRLRPNGAMWSWDS